MHTLWTNALGWLHWLAQGDNLQTTALAIAALASSLKVIAQKLGLRRAAAALGAAQVEIETHAEAAVQAKTATVACAAGLEEALKVGHLDRDTFDKVTRTIKTFSEDAGVETLLKPIVQAVRAEAPAGGAETPPAEVVRRATARLSPDQAPGAAA
jgi:hypothetical protein